VTWYRFAQFRLQFCSSSYDRECNDSTLRRTGLLKELREEPREDATPFVALFVMRIFLG